MIDCTSVGGEQLSVIDFTSVGGGGGGQLSVIDCTSVGGGGAIFCD